MFLQKTTAVLRVQAAGRVVNNERSEVDIENHWPVRGHSDNLQKTNALDKCLFAVRRSTLRTTGRLAGTATTLRRQMLLTSACSQYGGLYSLRRSTLRTTGWFAGTATTLRRQMLLTSACSQYGGLYSLRRSTLRTTGWFAGTATTLRRQMLLTSACSQYGGLYSLRRSTLRTTGLLPITATTLRRQMPVTSVCFSEWRSTQRPTGRLAGAATAP
ncbi:hypothetical protein J6590_033587 [Homalodisca vitripennis]|nr:hypothetical protein J6590_033587 [Homalodisca vitripennis]